MPQSYTTVLQFSCSLQIIASINKRKNSLQCSHPQVEFWTQEGQKLLCMDGCCNFPASSKGWLTLHLNSVCRRQPPTEPQGQHSEPWAWLVHKKDGHTLAQLFFLKASGSGWASAKRLKLLRRESHIMQDRDSGFQLPGFGCWSYNFLALWPLPSCQPL